MQTPGPGLEPHRQWALGCSWELTSGTWSLSPSFHIHNTELHAELGTTGTQRRLLLFSRLLFSAFRRIPPNPTPVA